MTTATVEILDVSPEQAEAWLSRNPRNSNLRCSVVEAYARDMLAGTWRLNGETVKLATDGTLLDGQHLCHAVIAAAVSVPMIVVRNLPASVMPTADAGVKHHQATRR